VWQTHLPRTGETDIDWTREQRFVRCFVDRTTGDIISSKGWTEIAKWGGQPAIEFRGHEYEEYADFTRAGGWGYKGDRVKWEESK
jgi:hypothetical protein